MLIASFHVFTSVAALDKIEDALGKFNDGPFFLGQFSLVCVAEH
jgi:glutathione S-transferase